MYIYIWCVNCMYLCICTYSSFVYCMYICIYIYYLLIVCIYVYIMHITYIVHIYIYTYYLLIVSIYIYIMHITYIVHIYIYIWCVNCIYIYMYTSICIVYPLDLKKKTEQDPCEIFYLQSRALDCNLGSAWQLSDLKVMFIYYPLAN